MTGYKKSIPQSLSGVKTQTRLVLCERLSEQMVEQFVTLCYVHVKNETARNHMCSFRVLYVIKGFRESGEICLPRLKSSIDRP